MTAFRALRLGSALAALAVLLPGTIRAQSLGHPAVFVPQRVDSGSLDNPSERAQVVFQQLVQLSPDQAWLQVRFGEASLPEGSFVRTTALADGDSQPLTGEQLLAEWNGHSAYFNGPAVLVELVAAPGSSGNRLVIEGALTADPFAIHVPEPGPSDTICNAVDDRVPSSDPAVARLLASGDVCSAFIASDVVSGAERFHLTAGHCLFGQTNIVIQFDVPLTSDQCELGMPPAAKQFAVDESIMLWSLGTGDDWGVFRTFDNPGTGKTSFEEQGASYARAATTPSSGTVRVTGHGADTFEGLPVGNATCTCDPKTFAGTWHAIQQTDSGPIDTLSGTLLTYAVDTCGGNSGSPVIDTETGLAVAIHHDGACHLAAAANLGTTTNHPEIDAAIALFGSGPVWQDLENGIGGIFGTPNLWGDGTLLGGDPVTLTLFGAAHNANVTLIIGFTAIHAPFKGGTLVPKPDILLFGLSTDALGILILNATWPFGIPPGFETYYHAWIEDGSVPVTGLSASSALLGTTP